MNNTGTLPRRNPLLLTAYAVAVIGMLGFVGWVVWPSQYFPSGSVFAEAVVPKAPATGPVASQAAVVGRAPSTKAVPGKTVYRQRLAVTGHGIWIDLNRETRAQIENAWRIFAARDIASRAGG